MLQGCYVLIQTAEMLIGAWIIYSLYPEFRKDSKWLRVFWGIGCAALCVLYVWSTLSSYISNIAILAVAAIFSLIYRYFLKVKLLFPFLLEMLYLTSISFLKLPVLILEGILFDKTLIEVNRGSRTILECCWCIMLIAAIILLIRKRKRFEKYKEFVYLLLSERIGVLFVVIMIQWSLLSYNMWLGKRGFQTIDLVLNVYLILGISLYLHYLLLRMAYNKMQQDKNSLNISQSLLQEQIEQIHKLYQENRLRLHEEYHMMEYLYCMITEKRYDRAEEFLHEFIGELDKEKAQVWTGLPFLDFILNYKKQVVDQKEIKFRLELDVYEYPFEEFELGILLGNLLDNAIEACEKCAPGRREIYLHIWNVRFMFMLKLTNSSSKSPEMNGGRFLTDKADKNAHGMGVELVKRILKKYDGDIDFQYDGGYFEAKLIAPITKEEEK